MLRLSAPLFCYLELIPECNSRCLGCSNVFVDDKHSRLSRGVPYLNAVGWREIVGKLKPHVSRLRITGGEATLHPEFSQIINAIQELDIAFVIFSNARWGEPEQIVKILKGCSQFQGFLISLHGVTADVHEAFCGVPGAFAETVHNIRYAVSSGLKVNTNTVITRNNLAQIEEIVELSRSLGAGCAVFNRYLGEAIGGLSATTEELRGAVHRLNSLKARGANVKLGTCVPQCFESNTSNGCLAGIGFWSIDPWGNVRPCNHVPLQCGNLRWQSVADIATGAAMQSWHRQVPAQCTHCSAFSKCHGGCRAQAVLLGLKRDDLIGVPIPEEGSNQVAELVFQRSARPLGRFNERREDFGYVLMRGNAFVPVTDDGKVILDECDGNITLGEIRERFGEDALSFVGSLHQQGLIEFEMAAVTAS